MAHTAALRNVCTNPTALRVATCIIRGYADCATL